MKRLQKERHHSPGPVLFPTTWEDVEFMGLNISLFSGYLLLPFPPLLTPPPLKKMQLADWSTGSVLILIDCYIAPGPLSTIGTCHPIHCLFDKSLTLQDFSWCNYNKCSCHHISLNRATILLSETNFFLFLFNLGNKL